PRPVHDRGHGAGCRQSRGDARGRRPHRAPRPTGWGAGADRPGGDRPAVRPVSERVRADRRRPAMSGAETIRAGRAALGIELGSMRIKACLVDADDPATVLAAGGHAWENSVRDGLWTYTLDDVWEGVRAAYAQLVADAESRHGESPATLASIGVSAMM